MELALTLPAVENNPPAYRSLPDATSAFTSGEPHSEHPIPEPRGNHALPFHLAMRLALTAPAVVKVPPAYRSLLETASAATELSIPEPRADHALASHSAMELSLTAPALVKAPP